MQVRHRSRIQIEEPSQPFATEPDHAECRRLHRTHGTSYYFATRCFPYDTRRRTHAVYGFVRIADEWVDNPGPLTVEERRCLLEDWRDQLLSGLNGDRPSHPVMRAFCDVCRETSMPVEEPLRFLDAMAQDIVVDRYPTFDSLRQYMRGSAAAVGAMMCSVMDICPNSESMDQARCLGEAMQLTNFLRDIGEDARRGRIYIPQEDLQRFGVHEPEILKGIVSDRFVKLMEFEIERTRQLYRHADTGIASLPRNCRPAVRLARLLYSEILHKIERQGYDVFSSRAATTNKEKMQALAKVLVGL